MPFDVISALVAAGAGYILGSLPFGYWIAKVNGVDIFSVGSRNPGATNVKRSVSSRAGNLVFALDLVKGLAATGWPVIVYSNSDYGYIYSLAGLVAAVVGHSYSCFTGFRGGKGVATMLGGVVALMPWAALIGVAIWLIFFYSTRYVSVASIALAISLPISNAIIGTPTLLFWVSVALAVVVVARHRSNIVRLMRGEENRFERKSKNAVAGQKTK